MPGQPGPEAETSVLRVVLVVFGVSAVVYFLLTLGSLIADTAYLNPAWSIATATVVFLVPPVLAAVCFLIPAPVLRVLLGGYAITFTLVVVLEPFMMTVRPMPIDEQPWPFTVTALGTIASALAWRPLFAWTHLVLTGLAIAPARYAMAGGVDPALALEDAFFTLSLITIFTALALVALANGRALDAATTAARVTASRAAATEAREREQSRLDALVHDDVIATLYYASLGKPELVASVRKQAGQALAHLARLREPEDGVSKPVPLTAFVSRVRSVVTGLDDSILLRVHGGGTGVVPPDVAAAFAEATSEAIRNSLEHAGPRGVARSVTVDLRPEAIAVEIRDEGAGFDPALVPSQRLGIAVSIRGRLAGVGGRAGIHSTPRAGTLVTLRWERE
ncbi:MAG: ATP-binding protein [Rhodoglobus sp.]